MLPSGEPVLERSITGPFQNEIDCIILYYISKCNKTNS
jgi:hypothetical protein